MHNLLTVRKTVFNRQERRDEIIHYIKWFKDMKQDSPNLKEIARYLCVSKDTVSRDVQKLKAQGRLDYNKYKKRSVRLIESQVLKAEV